MKWSFGDLERFAKTDLKGWNREMDRDGHKRQSVFYFDELLLDNISLAEDGGFPQTRRSRDVT